MTNCWFCSFFYTRIAFDQIRRNYTINYSSRDSNKEQSSRKDTRWPYYVFLTTSLSTLAAYHSYDTLCENKEENDINAGAFRPNLPSYTQDEIAQHSTKEKRIWVTFKSGVYDVTDFVDEHPGGEQILLAAGSSVEPFWVLYSIHHNPHVLKILETLRVGNVEASTVKATEEKVDPYAFEPKRNPILKPASLKPFNAEAPASYLVENFLTPKNHLPVPQIDLETYELEVEVEGKVFKYTLDDLKKLPKSTIVATIMCAGNRRSEMVQVKPVKGLNWGPAAIGNAKWTGVKLRDILKKAGVDEDSDYKHVQFEAYDYDAIGNPYAASIPFWKAVDRRGDVLLAYEMNDEPIPRDHGYPIRVIVPGTVGARNVKWLGRIVVSDEESDSHWQQNDYKGFCPSWNEPDYSRAPAIQELPVTSAICTPQPDDKVKIVDGHIVVKGYAWSGGGQRIVRVDVSCNQGKTWYVANFDHQDAASPPQHWAWTLWSIRIPVEDSGDNIEIWAKATDSSYNTQPETFQHIWNVRGVLGNAYHRIKITLNRS